MCEDEIKVIDADEGAAAERTVGQRSPKRRLLLQRPLAAVIVVAFAWRLLSGGAHRPARAPLLACESLRSLVHREAPGVLGGPSSSSSCPTSVFS